MSKYETDRYEYKPSRFEKLEDKRKRKEQKIRQKYGAYQRTRITNEMKKSSMKLWGNYCYICGFEPSKDEDLEFDHFWPEALGGESDPENLRPMCPRHHDMLGFKRGRNPYYLLENLFDEVGDIPSSEYAEFDPALVSLYIPESEIDA